MWYEILPSAVLVVGFIYVPSWLHWGTNKLFHNGKSSVRNWDNDTRDFMSYLRDKRLTGSEFVPRGLEGIPDAK